MLTFAESGLRDELLKAVAESGFVTPTPIQQQAIPHVLEKNQDLIAFAQTGTGKTAAFGLPCLHHIDAGSKDVQTIVLCPTRELCLQITSDLQSFSKHMRGLLALAVYGGARIENQIKALRQGAQIVVGTPGRTVDLIKRRKLRLDTIVRVVLDEADEMLSMGFAEDLECILSHTPDEKQVLLFSATMSKEMKSVTGKYMRDPHTIAVAAENKAADTVEHLLYQVRLRDRYEALKRIVDINPHIFGIIFCRTRRDTKDVALRLIQDGYSADALHGDLSQTQRDEVMNTFHSKALQLLVATDVAARGLDVDDLTHVINYNLPDEAQNYVHRSGRTGRAGKKGVSIAIVHGREGRRVGEIERTAGIKFARKPIPTGHEVCSKQLFALIDKIEKVNIDEQQIEPFLPSIYQKLEWLNREQLIKHFVSAEFNRFLSYYKDARNLNLPEHRRERKEGSKKGDPGKKVFIQFYVNLGSKNHMNPSRLIGLINESLQTNKATIGRIDVHKKFSLFEIEEAFMTRIVETMHGGKWGATTIQVEVTGKRVEMPKKYTSKHGRKSGDSVRFKSRKKGRKVKSIGGRKRSYQ